MFTTIRFSLVKKTSTVVSAARASASNDLLKLRVKFNIMGPVGRSTLVCPVLS